MYALSFTALLAAVAFASAGYAPAYYAAGPKETAAVIKGPSGAVYRSGYAAPSYAAPSYAAYATPYAPYAAAPFAAYAGPYVAPYAAGPAILAAKAYATGAAIIAPKAYAATYPGAPLAAFSPYAAYPGYGYEGQYVPDLSEKLYDDGSYKPYVYGH